MTVFLAIIITLLAVLLVLSAIYFILQYLINIRYHDYLSFDEALSILRVIIQSELETFTTDVFSNRSGLSNANFDTYYNDISSKIIEKMAPELMDSLTHYITREAVIIYIARAVKKYLTDQISDSALIGASTSEK